MVLVAIAACYSPTAPSGAPCDPAIANCPSGQACVDQGGTFVCLRLDEVHDAAVVTDTVISPDVVDEISDAAMVADLDGDGVLNADDNCPTIANANQANEDSDRFGDSCDPCPPTADANPIADADADGVADACDPHPFVAGDHITYFAGFSGTALPSSLTAAGAWSVAQGKASIELEAGQIGTLTTTLPTASSETISMRYTPTAIDTILSSSANPYAAAGVFTHRSGADDGLVCHVAVTFIMQTFLWLSQLPQDQKLDSTLFSASLNLPYAIGLTRDGTHYTCSVAADAGDPAAMVGDRVFGTVAMPKAGLRIKGSSVAVDWMMVITTP